MKSLPEGNSGISVMSLVVEKSSCLLHSVIYGDLFIEVLSPRESSFVSSYR